MQKKHMVNFSIRAGLMLLLSFPISSYAITAYIPQALRDCISVVHEMTRRTERVYPHFAELQSIVAENRIITSDSLIRRGLKEALVIIKNDRDAARDRNVVDSVRNYLRESLAQLDNRFGILALHADENQRVSFPIAAVASSLPKAAGVVDMMCLSSMLCNNNIDICGNIQSHRLFDNHIFFNANSMTNVLYTTPNIIFGTGVTSPVINAWSMAPSTMIQSPINMQISIPGALLIDRAETLDLHFLVAKQGMKHGKARIAVNVKYMGQYDDFNILSPLPTFSYEEQSNDFDIFEPVEAHEVRHVCVSVPLQKTSIKKCNFIVISVTRIDPSHGVEYKNDIYLASAILHYTQL